MFGITREKTSKSRIAGRTWWSFGAASASERQLARDIQRLGPHLLRDAGLPPTLHGMDEHSLRVWIGGTAHDPGCPSGPPASRNG